MGHLTGLDFAVFSVYIGSVLALGVWAVRRGVQTKRDYFLAGDKLAWWMIGGSILAANISSHHFVGIMGVAYKRGFVAFSVCWPSIFYCFSSLLFVFLPFYLRNGFYTMPEFLNRRYGTAARTAFGALILLTYVFVEISAVLCMGAIAVHALLGISMFWCIVGLAALTSVYTITGGLRAVVWTEMFQLVVLLVGGLCLTVMTVRAVGGWSAVMSHSTSGTCSTRPRIPTFPGPRSSAPAWPSGSSTAPPISSSCRGPWPPKTNGMRMGVVLAMYLSLVTPLVYIVPGLLAPLLFPHLDAPTTPFPPWCRIYCQRGWSGW